jgi:hypothetical protein
VLTVVGVILLATSLLGCGSTDRGLDTDELSDQLSISNLSKLHIRSPGDATLIVGLAIDVDVIHVGDLVIVDPFVMTWSLVKDNGDTLGSASKRLDGGMTPGQRRSITLNVTFGPVSSLSGVRDVVTFDLLD